MQKAFGVVVIMIAMSASAFAQNGWDAVPVERPAYWERKLDDGVCVILHTSGQYTGIVIRRNTVTSKWEWMSGSTPHQLSGPPQDMFCGDDMLPWGRS